MLRGDRGLGGLRGPQASGAPGQGDRAGEDTEGTEGAGAGGDREDGEASRGALRVRGTPELGASGRTPWGKRRSWVRGGQRGFRRGNGGTGTVEVEGPEWLWGLRGSGVAGGALVGMGELWESSLGTLGGQGGWTCGGSGNPESLRAPGLWGSFRALRRRAEIRGISQSDGGQQCPALTRQHQSKG